MLLCKWVPILWTYDQVWALLAFFSLPINKWTTGATPISPPNFSLFNSSVMLLRTNLLKSITNSHGWQQRPLIKIRINLLLTFPTNAQSWHCREKANASCCWLQTPRILHRLTHLPRHALLSSLWSWFAETFIAVFLICISRLYFSDPSPPAPFCKTFIGDTTEVALWPTLAHFITELLLLRDVESLFIEPVYFYPPSHLLPHRWIVKYFVQSPENRSRRKMFLILRFKLWPQLSFFPSGALLPRWGIHKKWTQSNNESFWKKWFLRKG